MTVREKLEKALAARYDVGHLEGMTWSLLKFHLNDRVAQDGKLIMITKLITELERNHEELKIFILNLIENGSSAEIKSAARLYLAEKMGIEIPQEDPYTDLIVAGYPFADRQSLREKLQALLESKFNRTLAANGPRYCGRSHSRMLIKHVGEALVIHDIYIDLLRTDITEIIGELVNSMQLNVNDTRDRMAQFTTQTKGFISVLKSIARTQFVQNLSRWCIVFDHHDLPETPPERKEFAELMIQAVMENNLPNIWIVMLGMGNCEFLPPRYGDLLMKVDLLQLSPTDIESFINDLYVKQNQQPMPLNDLQAERDKVLAGLQLPLQSIESMDTISLRLDQFYKTQPGAI